VPRVPECTVGSTSVIPSREGLLVEKVRTEVLGDNFVCVDLVGGVVERRGT
jgi:hypothetical protein